MADQEFPWSTRKDAYRKTMTYLNSRRKGEVTSLITPWPKLNSIGVNGWEWGTAIAFCARPGVGKTVLVDELVRKVYGLNPGIKMRILKFELEMLPQVTVIREFSAHLGQSYTYVCSAEDADELDQWGNPTGKKKMLSQQELMKCWEHVERKLAEENGAAKFPEDIIDVAPTVKEFENIINQYMEAYKTVTHVEKKGVIVDKTEFTKTLVTIDHLRLIMKEDRESEQVMLYNIAIMINRLKKKYHDSIIFVSLNHLLREVSSDARTEPGKSSNYLRDSDIFGADAIMQNFDIVDVMDRPAARNISRYGQPNYIVTEDLIVHNFVKVRNGLPCMSFFKGEFDKMQMVETETPVRAKDNLQTKFDFKKQS